MKTLSGLQGCWKPSVISFSVLVGAIATSGNCAWGQVASDNTLGSESSQVTSPKSGTFQIDGGATRGTNLFHSFREFSVPTRGEAFFNNPLGIQNIFTRVTGSSISNIDGLIKANGTANLFLLNPNGIIFGPNAKLNIGGSFFASTASSLNFADRTQFSATATQTPPLLTISVPVGLQYGRNAGSIQVQGSTLRVPNGQTLSLVGGDVKLEGGSLLAPGGRVELGGVAGEGKVGLNADGSWSFPPDVVRADVLLTNGAKVNALADVGGSIGINARNIELKGVTTRLTTGIAANPGVSAAKAGDITLNATGAITLESSKILNNVKSNAIGNAGDIKIVTGSLSLKNGAQIDSGTFGKGNAGDVTISAQGKVSLDEVRVVGKKESDEFPSAIRTAVKKGAVGDAGDISIEAESLFVTKGGELRAETEGVGNAGNIRIIAGDTVSFDGVDPESERSSIVFTRVERTGDGEGGNIYISARTVSLTDGAELHPDTLGKGNAGDITIIARESVLLDGVSKLGDKPESGIFSVAGKKSKGNAGNIRIEVEAGSLEVKGGARIDAGINNEAQGKTGNVTIVVRDTVSVEGVGIGNKPSSIRNSVAKKAVGNSGDITIEAGSVSLTKGGELGTETEGVGDAGNIRIIARDTVKFDGTVQVGKKILSTVVFTRVEKTGVGKGGNIYIESGSVSITNGAELLLDTYGKGNAGNITIIARERLSLDGVNKLGPDSAIISSVEEDGKGNAGNIEIYVGSLTITNGAKISTDTNGKGNAGKVTIRASQDVILDGVSKINDRPSRILIGVKKDAVGNGGDLHIEAKSLSLSKGAVLRASTSAQGKGGNITVKASTLEASGGGQILTTSRGGGKAGNITLNVTDKITVSGSDPEYDARKDRLVKRYPEDPDKVDNAGSASGLFANTEKDSKGVGGSLKITTGQLNVREGAQVNVSSEGSGDAGSLKVNANSIFLDNRGELSGLTESGKGGDINLQVQDLILMRRNSSISATANNDGDGGNITINSSSIVAFPQENSDISANAFAGKGGEVTINAQSIFGMAPRSREELVTLLGTNDSSKLNPRELPTNDITAISQTNPSLSGVVTINTPDIDPSSGLVELPNQPVTVEVVESCQTSANQSSVEFFNTGRGGIAPNPYEPLSSNEIWEDVAVATQRTENSASPATPISKIVEAQSWIINEKGEVVLVAQSPTAHSQIRCRLR